MKEIRKIKSIVALIAVLLPIWVMPACSSNSTQVEASGTRTELGMGSTGMELKSSSYPVTVSHGFGDLVLKKKPVRILSLSPTATEILFAIGAGSQVFAVDDQSNYPLGVPVTNISGWTPNLEAILGMEPDLVAHSYLPEDIEDGLASVGIPSMAQFAAGTLADTYQQIEMLGIATGNQVNADQLVTSMKSNIQALVDRSKGLRGGTFYHELDQTFYSITSSTLVGEIYTLVGLENIADGADPDGTGYPQLSEEYLLAQDPDFIFLADTKCCAQSIDIVKARPGWSTLSAVQENAVIELDDDIASRWGPRVVDFLVVVVEAMEQRAGR